MGYRVWTDEAFCIEETDGFGADEPWFHAFIVEWKPRGTTPVTMFAQNQATIVNPDDVDSGEGISFSAPDLFRGKFELG
jgi:hypothetical protein